jgi:GDPmannose 4,6-dehydratase
MGMEDKLNKRALITGITGQDGAYLAQFLIQKGYQVFGLARRSSSNAPLWRLDYLQITDRVTLVEGDITDLTGLVRVLEAVEPDEVYNLAAQSFVGLSWSQPLLTADVTAIGAHNMLEALRMAAPSARFYQASSSEMFGKVPTPTQNESTPFYPRSPYGVSKVYAHQMTINYRESFDMHASCGILFNHESPLRGIEFVTRKITDGVAKIATGKATHLSLGNIHATRDWGHARDYVRAMWLMLQKHGPSDYVIATGTSISVMDFAAKAFDCVGLDWRQYVKHDSVELMRPAEVHHLLGDANKARSRLGWIPEVSVDELVEEMVSADMKRQRS